MTRTVISGLRRKEPLYAFGLFGTFLVHLLGSMRNLALLVRDESMQSRVADWSSSVFCFWVDHEVRHRDGQLSRTDLSDILYV